jgi:hypothetical protein
MEKDTHIAIIEPLLQKHMEQVILLLQNMSVYLPPKESYSDIWESFINIDFVIFAVNFDQSENNIKAI